MYCVRATELTGPYIFIRLSKTVALRNMIDLIRKVSTPSAAGPWSGLQPITQLQHADTELRHLYVTITIELQFVVWRPIARLRGRKTRIRLAIRLFITLQLHLTGVRWVTSHVWSGL